MRNNLIILLTFISINGIFLNSALCQEDSIVLSIAGINKGDISKDAIIKNPFIKCSNKDMDIIGFSLSFNDLTGKLVKYDENGNKLSGIIMKEIQALAFGESFIITVRALNKKDGKIYDLWIDLSLINS